MSQGERRGNMAWRGRKRLGPLHELEFFLAAFAIASAGLYVAVPILAGIEPQANFREIAFASIAGLAAYILIGLLLVVRDWEDTPKCHDLGTEERPGYYSAFLLLGGLLAFLCWAAFKQNMSPGPSWPPYVVILFLSAIGAAFVPLAFGYHLVAVEAMNTRKTASYLADPEGPMGMPTIVGSIVVILLVASGAWAAGEKMFSLNGYFGLMSMGLVVLAFLSFIVITNLAGFKALVEQAPDMKIKAAGAAHPGAIVSGIDALLVRLLAPLSGATLPGWIRSKVVLCLIMLPLAVLGFVLPNPLGLVPISVAMLIVLALGRRWAWVEEDREKALRIQTTKSDQFRIGFANDLRDEALLGYAWLFVLVPLALRQLQLQFGIFPATAQDQSLINWFNFFGTELAKGVPIVSWIDIYDVDQTPVFRAETPLARHVLFIARLVIDLVIIAALLQAIGIAQRNHGQKNLFKSGQVDLFDPFMENKILLDAWQQPANGEPPLQQKWQDFFEDHRKESAALDRGDYRYNPRRLSELTEALSGSAKEDDKRRLAVVQWLAEGLLVGSLGERLQKLSELYPELVEAERVEADDAHARRRKYERFLDDAIADFAASHADDRPETDYQHLSRILSLIRSDRGLDVQRTRAFAMLSEKRTLAAARALAARLSDEEQAPGVLQLSAEDARLWAPKRQGRLQDRTLAAEQLVSINVASQEISEADKKQLEELRTIVARRRLTRAERHEFEMLKQYGAGVNMTAQEREVFAAVFQAASGLIRNS